MTAMSAHTASRRPECGLVALAPARGYCTKPFPRPPSHIMSSTPILRSFVNGAFKDPASEGWTEHRNPSDSDDIVARVPDSTPEVVDAAVAGAAEARRSWRAVP